MDVLHLPADPDAAATVAAIMAELGNGPLALPADADLSPLLTQTAGAPAVWVSAEGPGSLEAGVVLYVHGGGFEHRKPDLMNVFAHRVSRATGRPVLVSHYRLAPANPYPAPLDDVVALYRGLLDEGVPAGRIVLLGESSGAALALSALLVLKAAGVALPAAVITHSAVTDLALTSPSIDANTARDAGVTRALLTRFISQYLGDVRADQAPQSPIYGSLDGLPPLLLAVGSAEALLDDTLRFAQAASDAGTTVSVDVYEDMQHVFPLTTLSEESATGKTLLNRIAEWVGTYAGK